jgi:hypothetical protein
VYDSSIFFRQPVEGSTQPNRSLVPLAFDQWRVPFIGDWKLRQREKVERKEPRRGTFSPPLPGLIETNLDQPCPEVGFEAKLLEMGEGLKCSLLDNVLDIRVTADS